MAEFSPPDTMGLKGRFRVRTLFEKMDHQLGGKFLLGHADLDQGDHRFERGLGDLHRPLHILNFDLILPQTEFSQRRGCIREISSGCGGS